MTDDEAEQEQGSVVTRVIRAPKSVSAEAQQFLSMDLSAMSTIDELDPTGGPLASAELYDPLADGGVGGFGEAAGLSVGREACTATLLPGGGVLIAGGRNTAALSSAEIWKLE